MAHLSGESIPHISTQSAICRPLPRLILIFACLLSLGSLQPAPAQSTDTLYVRVTRPSIKVRRDYSSQSGMLGFAEAGQRFRVLDYTDDAYKIAYGDQEGWIDRGHGEFVKNTPGIGSVLSQYKREIIIGGLVVVGLAVLVVAFVLIARAIATRAASRIASNKELLLVALNPKEIRHSLGNTSASIEQCFAEVGYDITRIRTTEAFDGRVRHRRPDAVLVDWEFGPEVADEIEITLANDIKTASVPVIYYNVPEGVAAGRHPRIRNVYYVGSEISDRDLFKIIQPHTMGVTQTSIVRKDDASSAIEGDIGEGGLSAVFQLIEIGQKNGGLLVNQQRPYGVVFFEMGNPVYAKTAAQVGDKAIFELLNLKEGHFRFANDKKAPERNCAVSTMGVLMEWARVRDESARD